MSSTNKTTNYELSQFIGTDKPAWLSDYNGDMGKIDAGIHSAQTTATGADGKADSNTTKIGTLANLTTDVKTDLVSAINEVDGHADTAQNTANSANSTASSASLNANKALDEIAKLNLTSFKTYALNEITATNASLTGTPSITIAKDSTGSVFKLYGTANITSITGASVTLTIGSTGIAPNASFNIICAGIYTQNGTYFVTSPTLTVNPNQTIDITFATNSGTTGAVRLSPCLYFAKDFGDQPE